MLCFHPFSSLPPCLLLCFHPFSSLLLCVQQFADVASLTAFTKPVWSQQLPVVSYCRSETLPIGDVKKGVTVSHTGEKSKTLVLSHFDLLFRFVFLIGFFCLVWVSIVPVRFSAAADLDLALSW
jgi:hypothetical protein